MNGTLSTPTDAFLAAYGEAASLVRRICYRWRVGEEADEIYQQVGLAGWQAISKGIEVRNWQAFIVHVTKCRCRDCVEGRERRKVFSESCVSDKDPLDPRAQDPAENLLASELEWVIARFLAQLPLDQRRVLELRSKGRTNKEVANKLGISERAVACRVSRALMNLRRQLQISKQV